MIIEYTVGRFLHEEYIVKHVIPENSIQYFDTPDKKDYSPTSYNEKSFKKSEWSTLRKSKYI